MVFVGLLCTNANLSNAIYPVFVTSMIGSGHANTSQVGILATAEFLSYGLAAMFAGRLLAERHLRLTAGICLALQLLMGFATTRLGFMALLPCRALFGAAEGVLVWIVYAYAARMAHPGRLVAIYTTSLMLVGVVWSWLAPSLVLPAFGHAGVVLFLVAPSLVALVLLPCGPNELAPLTQSSDQAAERPKGRIPVTALLVLLSIGFWTAYTGIFWVYSEPLAARLTGPAVQYWLVVSLAMQIIGAALAAILAQRLPYRLTVSTGLIILIAQVSSILLGVGGLGFLVWSAVYGFFGYFLVPFFVAALIQMDPSRRSVVYFPAAQFLAASLGPLLVSQFVSDSDLSSGLIIDLAAIGIAPVLFWIALAVFERAHRAAAELPAAVAKGAASSA